jgi:DNA-binding HxlR family transcriptional regulator/putative sterol carrier protein
VIVAARPYGQYCGLARALELVGERWALLVVRDLLLGPKRFTDLRQGLPRIPTNVLSERLKGLEEAGIVRRRVLARPARSVVYELTDYGADLEDVVLRLGRWGARSLGPPGADDVLTPDALVLALRATFRPAAARKLRASYELHLGPVVVNARIRNGTLEAAAGSLAGTDLVIDAGMSLKALLNGELGPAEAVESGAVRIAGDPLLLVRFVEAFHLESTPAAPAA